MNKTTHCIEIFCSPGCSRCDRTVTLLQSVLTELQCIHIKWQKLNVVEELDYAVELGIRATPSIVIDGKLYFTGQPIREKLVECIRNLDNAEEQT